MKTKRELEQLAESIYREYPNNPLDFTNWHYNKDVNCHRKRKAFINGYFQCQEDMADKYTEKDMLKAFMAGVKCESKNGKNFEQFINSLNKQDNEKHT
jgi:hypothetical protein